MLLFLRTAAPGLVFGQFWTFLVEESKILKLVSEPGKILVFFDRKCQKIF